MQQHEDLINHLMAGTCCYAPSDRYCDAGRELWLAYQAQCVADGGRDVMTTVRQMAPGWAEEIKSRALTLMNNNGGNHG